MNKINSRVSFWGQSELGQLAFLEDNKGNIWIGTEITGLYKYIPDKDTLINFKNDPKDITSLSSNRALKVFQDSHGSLWIGTDGGGLNLYEDKTNSFKRYRHIDGNLNSLINDVVYSIYEDKKGFLWLSTPGGLDRFDPVKNEFIHFRHIDNDSKSLSTNWAIPLCEDGQDNIWFINADNIPEYFDYKNFSFMKCNTDPQISGHYSHGASFKSFLRDHSGILWFGTWVGGINKLDPSKQMIDNWEFFSDNRKVKGKNVSTICEDKYNNLAVRTWEGSLYIFNQARDKQFSYRIGLSDQPYYNLPVSTFDKRGDLWLGERGPKVMKFDKRRKIIEEYQIQSPNRYFFDIQNRVLNIFHGAEDGLYIVTLDGIAEFDKKTGSSHLYQINTKKISDDYRLVAGFQDKTNRIWLATNVKGLYEFLPNKKEFIKPIDVNVGGLSFYEDKNNNFWLGTFSNGLFLLNKKTGIKETYNMKDGLPSNQIRNIAEDDEGNLWLLTLNGISKFNHDKKSFKNYGIEDGFQSEQYHSIHKSPNGEIFLGGSNGLISFFPNQINDNSILPKVVITNISLFNRSDDSLQFHKSFSELKEVELSYDQNDLNFEFVALHYVNPKENLYSVKLENFDENWTRPITMRIATYTNLDPGEYIFRVKGANSDGVWNNEGAAIRIIILPPWWQTTWAYILYIILLLSIMYFLWKMQLKKIRAKHEYAMSKFEAQKLHEVDEMKSRFFTNISHEFRTPLTLILGPVKQMIEKLNDGKMKDELSIVHKNANKLLGLVNQLLDISKLESGNMKLQTISRNVVPLLKGLLLSFSSYAERKRITLNFNSSEDEIIAYVDKDKIEKIITNILSNAFKFTPEGGRIEVTISKSVPNSPLERGTKGVCQNVEIKITDTGIGISKEKLPKIFDRFYQVDGSHTREQEGTGIGLALTKELVELHKGKIEVESEEGKGTTFIVSLPLGKDHLKPEEICEPSLSQTLSKGEDFSEETIFPEETKTGKHDIDLIIETAKPLLMIVEDNSDVRNYIKDNLKNDFRVLEAIDGEDGWNKAIDPAIGGTDLIVSDVMMPKIDGFKLCEKLKTDERTSHIPVILLTAKASSTDKIEGYETGADDYIMKPFEPEELKARIKNLIEQRKRIHEHFRKEGIFELDQTIITSVDKKFLKKAFEIISQNISDSSFTIETFAEKLYVSKSLLRKKIVSLTGEPPVELLKRIRLKRATELIEKNFGNLSEIALEVGFNNPAYFSECFKKQFGVSPSQYHSQNTNNK